MATDPAREDLQTLRRGVRELTALSTLSAVWGKASPAAVADQLADVLYRALPLDFVHVRLLGPGGEVAHETTLPRAGVPELQRAILAANPAGPAQPVPGVLAIPLGWQGECGVLVAGSGRPGFPGELERLLLGVAANQAAVVLQHQRGEEELVDFFENASVPLHSVGPDGTILRVNQAELDLLGHARAEYVGRHIAEFHADPAVIADILERLHRGEKLVDYPARLRCKDGSIRQVRIDSSVRWAAGRFLHTRCVTRDVTEQHRAGEALRESQEALRRQAEELREADRRKDEFLATLAHELRNPLAPIRSALALLRSADPGTGERARVVMERQLAVLVRLVDDLLDVSRITRGKVQLRKERVSLATIVQSAVESARPLMGARGHRLSIRLPAGPVILEADPTRLAQVLSNLLGNAAKYTEPGGEVHLIAERDGTSGQVSVSVRDTGIGLAPEHIPGLFEMFSQVQRASDLSQGGLGIGLALVRSLVELHGGSVEARSDGPGRGSEFIVRLPAPEAQATPPPAPGQPPRQVEGTPSTCRILVVDDNRDAADTLALLLEELGHETETAHDGAEVLPVASAFRPDIVFLDIGLPKLDGYQVARAIRREPWGGDVVLIALTGWGQDGDKRRAHEAGFDHHLTKPLDLETLERVLASTGPPAPI